MKSENHFFDLLAVSNSIIDSVSGDLQSKVFDSHPENEAITFTGLIVSFDTQTQEKGVHFQSIVVSFRKCTPFSCFYLFFCAD